MRILFINNDGAGFADQLEVRDGIRVESLFTERMPYAKAHDYLIRVNRQEATADQVLQDGDRVSFTPKKIEGAQPRLVFDRWQAVQRDLPGTPW